MGYVRNASAGLGILAAVLGGGIARPLHAREEIQVQGSSYVGRPIVHRLGVEYVVLRGNSGVVIAGSDKDNKCIPYVNFPKGVSLDHLSKHESAALRAAIRKACGQAGAEWKGW